jgi:hypothetical protein
LTCLFAGLRDALMGFAAFFVLGIAYHHLKQVT